MNWKIAVGGMLIVVLAAGGAILLASGETPSSDLDLTSIPPPVVSGASLPPYDLADAQDVAQGLPMPEARGWDFELNPVAITRDGRPKVILFLAHWCSHCQAEVPVVQAWINAGRRPAGVDFYSVVTAIDELSPNYPPDAWLEREGWTLPVLVDIDRSVADSYGLTAFPFFVFVDGAGSVLGRVATELPAEALTELFARLVP